MLAKGGASSLGYSVFTPGTALRAVCHETEELAYVVTGTGELRLDDGAVPFREETRCTSRPVSGTRSSNTGDEDVIMVFGFPIRTIRRPSAGDDLRNGPVGA